MSRNRADKPGRRTPIGVRRKALEIVGGNLMRFSRLEGAPRLPLVIEPAVDDVDLLAWVVHNRRETDDLLWQHSALLFRGFGIDTSSAFEMFVRNSSSGEPLAYRDRTTPRKSRGDKIYTSTVHPADQRINLHNEGTYWLQWAMKLYFCCIEPATTGGQTPLADVRRVYERIDRDVLSEFEARGMMLVRNYNDGFGLPWQEVFQTQSKDEVEAYCNEHRIGFEWKDGERLRTWQVRPAIQQHPRSNVPVWFNHVAFFHHSTLEPGLRSALLAEFGTERVPYNTFYGDGGPIASEIIAHIRDAYDAETVLFEWRRGDVLLLDNMSVAHGREAFTGKREVLAAMTEPHAGRQWASKDDVPAVKGPIGKG